MFKRKAALTHDPSQESALFWHTLFQGVNGFFFHCHIMQNTSDLSHRMQPGDAFKFSPCDIVSSPLSSVEFLSLFCRTHLPGSKAQLVPGWRRLWTNKEKGNLFDATSNMSQHQEQVVLILIKPGKCLDKHALHVWLLKNVSGSMTLSLLGHYRS